MKVEPEKMQQIYDAIRNTPTSYNGQQVSVIAVDDQQLKEQLYEITNQKQIKTCSHFLVFCIDYHKLRVAAGLHGEQTPPFESTIDGYTVGVIDASLAMMSAVTVAESLGLGCCCIGYTRTADPRRISDLLLLPEGVSIVCGLAIGYPREMPDLKPKLPQPAVIHTNHYSADEELKPLLGRIRRAYHRIIQADPFGRPDDQRLVGAHRRLPPPFDGARHRRLSPRADRIKIGIRKAGKISRLETRI